MKRFFQVTALLILASSSLTNCSGGGTTTTATTLSGSDTLTGTLYQPNAVDPLPGALMYITSNTSSINVTPKAVPSNFGGTVTVGTDCESLPTGTSAAASACSDADGTFTLTISDCSLVTTASAKVTINVLKGAISFSFTTSLESCDGIASTVPATDSKAPGTASTNVKIAVCSGEYDQMENVLARMGYAPSDTDGDGDQDLNGWDRTVNANFNYFRGGSSSTESGFPSCCKLLKGETVDITDKDGNAVTDSSGNAISWAITDYDLVFLNCGSGCESTGYATVIEDVLSNSVSVIQNFVSNGGGLYVTDLSYDFIEQAFPGKVDFHGDADRTTAGTEGAAQVGTSGDGVFEPLASTVNQTTLKNYLKSVSAGNTDCGTPTGTGSLLSGDATVNICHFLSSWAVMVGAATGTTNWIQGAAQFGSSPTTNVDGNTVTSGSTDIPLTISFDSESGRVMYTSYHTDNSSTTTTEFLPQERILQFLILDVLGSL